MIQYLFFTALLFFSSDLLAAKKVWVAMEPQVSNLLHNHFFFSANFQKIEGRHETFIEVDEDILPQLSGTIHHHFKRCGGYRVYNDKPAEEFIIRPQFFYQENAADFLYVDYFINQEEKVLPMLKTISEFYMNKVIYKLSSFKTRYYKSPEGIASMFWIFNEWKTLSSGRADITVELKKHTGHDQPSVILTIKGSEDELDNIRREIIILGAHADSINTDHESIHSPAPGADDNAAGIAVLSAVIKNIIDLNYRPRRTLQFMAYAAEEVGLQGSYAIAREYKQLSKKVIGVLQFDGVNFSGKNYEMALISDLTHPDQNQFMAELIDTYLHIPWTYDQCGYACSDHAAWNYEGFRASYPIEGIKKDQNPYIHSIKDTFAKSDYSSAHARKFAQLAMAYVVELDH